MIVISAVTALTCVFARETPLQDQPPLTLMPAAAATAAAAAGMEGVGLDQQPGKLFYDAMGESNAAIDQRRRSGATRIYERRGLRTLP